MRDHSRSLFSAPRFICNGNAALSQRPPPPRFAWSPSPASGGGKRERSRNASASELDAWRSANRRNSSPLSAFTLCFSLPSYERREAERRQMRSPTAAPTGARRALIAARSPVGVPPRLSPKGVFHPKGSASGQASWDVVCTGVTRLRLSQSRDAPPTPVIMPGDMMPKPPGSGLQIRPQAPHPAPPSGLPPEGVL